ncbi:MAG: hypothetical protein V3V97_04630, partial [Hyphomicrobiaceae bacterium]
FFLVMGANVGFEELSRRAVDDREPSRLTLCRPGEAVNVSLLYFPDLQNCGQLDLSTSQGAL